VKEVLEQLKAVAKGDIKTPDTGKRKFGNIIFAAVRLTPADIVGLLRKVRTACTIALLKFAPNFQLQTLCLHACWNPSFLHRLGRFCIVDDVVS
jgi:hypothetical protein